MALKKDLCATKFEALDVVTSAHLLLVVSLPQLSVGVAGLARKPAAVMAPPLLGRKHRLSKVSCFMRDHFLTCTHSHPHTLTPSHLHLTSAAAKEAVDGLAVSKLSPAAGKKTDWDAVNWAELGQTKDGRPGNIKFSSWNVNGVRAWLKVCVCVGASPLDSWPTSISSSSSSSRMVALNTSLVKIRPSSASRRPSARSQTYQKRSWR